jgi:hypothetical protein
MMFWGDVVSLYPEVIPDIPKNVIALEWGYESGHPFDTRCANYADAGIPYYVCPSTSNAVSFTGRADNAIENIAAAARSGVKHGAIGLLNTEWGDGGHWHPLSVAYLGLMAGASASWNATADVQDGLLRNLSLHAFRDSTGKVARAFCDLGNIYLIFKGRHLNTSVPGHLLLLPDMLEHSDKATVSEYEELEARLDHIARQVSGDAMEAPDASIIRSEIDQVIGILRFSARVGKAELGSPDGTDLQKELESARCIQERVWLLRNRPGGLADSLSKLRWAQEPLLAYR